MSDLPNEEPQLPLPEGWHLPLPRRLPRPTYWPVVMAAGTILSLWGIVTSAILSGAGLALFALALGGWIREMLHGL